jgi:hypothetical protein
MHFKLLFTLKNEEISIWLLIEKHSYAITGCLLEKFDWKRGKCNKTHDIWKANFFLKGNKNSNESNRFGLPFHQNTSRYFGNETFRRRPFQPYRKHIKFRNARNEFQESLANYLKKINSSSNIFVFVDKTRNIYKHRSTHMTSLCTT